MLLATNFNCNRNSKFMIPVKHEKVSTEMTATNRVCGLKKK